MEEVHPTRKPGQQGRNRKRKKTGGGRKTGGGGGAGGGGGGCQAPENVEQHILRKVTNTTVLEFPDENEKTLLTGNMEGGSYDKENKRSDSSTHLAVPRSECLSMPLSMCPNVRPLQQY